MGKPLIIGAFTPMSEFSGYSVDHRLHRSPRHVVYRGRRSWDGQAVILKTPAARFPSPQEMLRLRREFDILTRLEGRGAPKAFGLERHDQGLVLVTEDIGGTSLPHHMERGPLSPSFFLGLALSCCRALATIHDAGILHKDVSPANIILAASGAVQFIDFADSADLSTPQPTGQNSTLVGTPAYISPEQTGRILRRLDHRSDYYALGATFYELLTGRSPFQGEDTLDLLLAHVGRPPEPPHSQNPRIPQCLSQIVLKLLAKSPEERYQSLQGLISDLEQAQTLLKANPDPQQSFPLGTHDQSDIFRLSQRLFGRSDELKQMESVIQRSAPGRPELILIEGPSGVGKTALVAEFTNRYQAQRGFTMMGRFEEFRRSTPYAAVIDAVGQYLRSFLSGSEEELARINGRLSAALSGQGGALTAAFPDLELIVGKQDPLPQLSPSETENRFIRAFRAMLAAILDDRKPLAFVLDDLQWADRSSLHLLQNLMSPLGAHYPLVLIATARTDLPEVSDRLTFFFDRLNNSQVPLHRVTISALDVQSVSNLLGETLNLDPEDVSPLAQVCHQKTSGNPFFLSRFITSLHEKDLIFFDRPSQHWHYTLDAITELDMTDNVVDLMVEKLSRLSPAGNRVLQRASCIGQTFDLETLTRINDVGPSVTLRQLLEGLRQGLVVALTDNYDQFLHTEQDRTDEAPQPHTILFRFLHDRVHQAAYSLIPLSERGLRHLNIGRTLLERTSLAEMGEQVFAIVDQFNRGWSQSREPTLQKQVAELNLMAARKARNSGATADALSYAQDGIRWIGESGWHERHALCLALHNEGVEAAFRCGEHKIMEQFAKAIIHHAHDPLERSQAIEATIAGLTLSNDNIQAIELCLQQLDALGFHLPRHPSALRQGLASVYSRWLFSRIRLGRRPPFRTADAETAAAIRLMRMILPPVIFSAPDLLAPMTSRLLALAEVHGDQDSLAYALSRYSALRASLGDASGAVQAAKLALSLSEHLPLTSSTIRTQFGALFHGLHWVTSLRDLRPTMLRLLSAGLNDSDPEKLSYVAGGYLCSGFHAGIDLEILREDLARAWSLFQHLNSDWSQPYASCLQQAIENLTVLRTDPTSLNGAYYNEVAAKQALATGGNLMLLNAVLAVKATLSFIFCHYDEVRDHADMIRQNQGAAASTLIWVSVTFLEALAWSRDPASGTLQKRLKVLRRNLKQLQRWNMLGGANMHHRVLLLSAEEARLEGRTLRAAELYDLAIKEAHAQGFTHEEALANEFSADFHEQRGRPMIAEAYRRQAHYRYRLWGAMAKAAAMEEEWPDLSPGVEDPSVSLLGSPGRSSGARAGVELAAIMKAAQAISGEIQRPALLEKLLRITMSTAGAQRGLLFLRSPAGWVLEAKGESTADRITLLRTPILIQDITTPSDAMDTIPYGEDTARGRGERASPRRGLAVPEHSTAWSLTDGPQPTDQPVETASFTSVEFSRAAFNYAVRTREPLVLNDAANEGGFASDPTITLHQTRSLLCLPLFQQSDLRGMLYLENNLTAGAFTADKLEVLSLLAAQVVVSLDNAILYENLTNLNRTLEAEVAERTHEATEKSHLLETTLDHMSDGLVVYDADDRLVLWNDRVVNLFALDPKSLAIGVTQNQIAEFSVRSGALDPRVADLVARRLEVGEPPFPDRSTSEIQLSSGRFLQMRRTILPDGSQVQVFLDVTEERRREREVMLAHKAAEKALRNLQDAQESLIQAEKMASLGQLVAGVAHEINTPVGITLTAASFLGERAQALRSALDTTGIRKSQLVQFIDQADETTTLMMNNIQRAADLIQSFKQVAVDQTSGERRSVSMKKYFEEVLRSFGPMLKKTSHRVTISCPEDLIIESYPGALSQILTNLIMNSVTHAFPEGRAGTMAISITHAIPREEIEITFSDDGVGIPASLTSQVFDPFVTTRRGSGGSGLGLNIVYNLVTSILGGSITLHSQEGQGCTFSIRFPATFPSTTAADDLPPTSETQLSTIASSYPPEDAVSPALEAVPDDQQASIK